MLTLFALQSQLSSFYDDLHEYLALREDAIASMMSRPSGDSPQVALAGWSRQQSPVERCVISMNDGPHVAALQRRIEAVADLFDLVQHSHKAILRAFLAHKWRGDLPEDILYTYADLLGVEVVRGMAA